MGLPEDAGSCQRRPVCAPQGGLLWRHPAGLVAPLVARVVVDGVSVLQSLRADAWLHGYGDPTAPEAAAVRAQVRAAFADDDPAWIETCWPRFHEVLSAALTS